MSHTHTHTHAHIVSIMPRHIISLHITSGHWSQSGLVWGWGCSPGLWFLSIKQAGVSTGFFACSVSHSCHILPFQPILWNKSFPPEPAKTGKHSPKSISEGGRIWQVCIPVINPISRASRGLYKSSYIVLLGKFIIMSIRSLLIVVSVIGLLRVLISSRSYLSGDGRRADPYSQFSWFQIAFAKRSS